MLQHLVFLSAGTWGNVKKGRTLRRASEEMWTVSPLRLTVSRKLRLESGRQLCLDHPYSLVCKSPLSRRHPSLTETSSSSTLQ